MSSHGSVHLSSSAASRGDVSSAPPAFAFGSVLCPGAELEWSSRKPECFPDVNLDQLVRALTAGLEQYDLALVAWALMHASGVHATVAGVLLGLVVPARVGRGEREAMTHRFVGIVQPWSAGLVLPVFAFFAAGVSVVDSGGLGQVLTDPIAIGVMAGLVLGKTLGIWGGVAILVKTTPLRLGNGVDLPDLLGAAMLARHHRLGHRRRPGRGHAPAACRGAQPGPRCRTAALTGPPGVRGRSGQTWPMGKPVPVVSSPEEPTPQPEGRCCAPAAQSLVVDRQRHGLQRDGMSLGCSSGLAPGGVPYWGPTLFLPYG